MPCFRVTFVKQVTSDDGHDIDAVQAAFDVNAVDETQAAMLAQERFCGDRSIVRWQLNADRCEVELHEPHRDPVATAGLRREIAG